MREVVERVRQASCRAGAASAPVTLVRILHVLAIGSVLMLSSGKSIAADSQFGYTTTSSNKVTAQARVNITVNVPKLIFLRVGSYNTIVGTNSVAPAIPTASVVGNNTNVRCSNGAPPTFTGSVSRKVLIVSAWTNSLGGGSVGCPAITAVPAAISLSGSDITVSGAEIAHPGTDTSCSAATMPSFAAKTVASGTLPYHINVAGLAALAATPASSNTEMVTYTATSL